MRNVTKPRTRDQKSAAYFSHNVPRSGFHLGSAAQRPGPAKIVIRTKRCCNDSPCVEPENWAVCATILVGEPSGRSRCWKPARSWDAALVLCQSFLGLSVSCQWFCQRSRPRSC